MIESTEMWTTVGLILGGVLIATTTYFKTNGRGRDDPQQASMGLFIERDTVRSIDRNVERIADACEALADKRQDAMSSSITQMLDLMKEREKRDKGPP